MTIKKDYANRASLFTPTEEYDNPWHSDLAMARKGIIAAIVVILAALTLSVVSYAAQAPATQSVSSQSLVDQNGEE